jgi:hypothetical protein
VSIGFGISSNDWGRHRGGSHFNTSFRYDNYRSYGGGGYGYRNYGRTYWPEPSYRGDYCAPTPRVVYRPPLYYSPAPVYYAPSPVYCAPTVVYQSSNVYCAPVRSYYRPMTVYSYPAYPTRGSYSYSSVSIGISGR